MNGNRDPHQISHYSPEAETAVLGAALQDLEAARLAVAELRPSDFFLTAHQTVFASIMRVIASGTPVDRLTVYQGVTEAGESIPATMLLDLENAVPTAAHTAHYITIIKGESRTRRLRAEALRVVDRIDRRNGSRPGEILADFWENVREIQTDREASAPALESPVAILRKLRDQGDPVPTGIAVLDERTRGGMRPGKALVIGGTAGAGKTAAAIQAMRAGAEAGCVATGIFSDEGRDPAIIRLGQQFGYMRDALEAVDHPGHDSALAALERDLAGLDIFFPDPDADGDVTLEGTVEALVHGYPGRRKVVVVDSIQTVPTRQNVRDVPSLRERIMGNARLARALAVEHGLVMIYTSEVNRSWYRARKEEDRASDLAAFAEARIEFSGDVLLAMRAMDEDPDLVEVRIPKNRLGTRQPFLLRLDRTRARFEAVDGDYATAMRSAADTERLDEAREAILRELTEHPGMTRRQLQELVGIKVGVFSDALRALKADGIVQTAPKGTAVLHSLTTVEK